MTEDELVEHIRSFAEAGSNIVEILEELKDNNTAARTVALVITHMLVNRAPTEQAAHDMFELIIDTVDASVIATKEHGITSWAEGTPH